MTDLVITATSVVAGTPATKRSYTAGGTITAGQPVYIASTNLALPADSDSATPAARQPIGIALNGAAINQPVMVQSGGDITLGATLVPGTAYYLSGAPGGICPFADVGAGEYVCLLGIAKSATVLSIGIQYPDVSL